MFPHHTPCAHPGNAYESFAFGHGFDGRALNAGVVGFNRWSFLNRGDLDGQWQLIDTWDPATKTLLKKFPPKPNGYFAYGLISRLTAKHSAVVATELRGGQIDGTNRVFAAALRSPKGRFSCVIVNDAPRAWPAQLQVSGLSGSRLYQYRVTSQQKDNPGLKIVPDAKVLLTGATVEFGDELPPMSLTIYSTYNLGPTDNGIIAE